MEYIGIMIKPTCGSQGKFTVRMLAASIAKAIKEGNLPEEPFASIEEECEYYAEGWSCSYKHLLREVRNILAAG